MARMLAAKGKAGLADRQIEVLGHLVAVDDPADSDADFRLAAQRSPLRPTGAAIYPRSRSVAASNSSRLRLRTSRKVGIAADHQPLAGKVRRGDRGHVAIVEQRQLQGAADGRPWIAGPRSAVIQSSPAGLEILVDARLR